MAFFRSYTANIFKEKHCGMMHVTAWFLQRSWEGSVGRKKSTGMLFTVRFILNTESASSLVAPSFNPSFLEAHHIVSGR